MEIQKNINKNEREKKETRKEGRKEKEDGKNGRKRKSIKPLTIHRFLSFHSDKIIGVVSVKS